MTANKSAPFEKKEKRQINGILLIDKPLGLSSNSALQKVKALFQAKKAGHTGSLDPLATGMLPVCFGRATKFSQFLLDAKKHYRVTGQLGLVTTTGDLEGEVVKQVDDVNLTEEQVQQAAAKFYGESMQIPSMYSAIKHKGKPLYYYARQNIEIEREPRPITLERIELEQFDAENKTFSLDVICSKGTYIRSLIQDIGEALGVGATVTQLARVGVAGFREEEMVSLPTLQEMAEEKTVWDLDRLLLPIEKLFLSLPAQRISALFHRQLREGKLIMVAVPGVVQQDLVRLSNESGDFLGLAEVSAEGKLKARCLV